jgi:hypothetical protein
VQIWSKPEVENMSQVIVVLLMALCALAHAKGELYIEIVKRWHKIEMVGF